MCGKLQSLPAYSSLCMCVCVCVCACMCAHVRAQAPHSHECVGVCMWEGGGYVCGREGVCMWEGGEVVHACVCVCVCVCVWPVFEPWPKLSQKEVIMLNKDLLSLDVWATLFTSLFLSINKVCHVFCVI